MVLEAKKSKGMEEACDPCLVGLFLASQHGRRHNRERGNRHAASDLSSFIINPLMPPWDPNSVDLTSPNYSSKELQILTYAFED